MEWVSEQHTADAKTLGMTMSTIKIGWRSCSYFWQSSRNFVRTLAASVLSSWLLCGISFAATGPILSAPIHSGSQFQFTLLGETNVPYILQSSTNLQEWFAVATNVDLNPIRTVVLNATYTTTAYRAVVATPLFAVAISASGSVA